jgi:transcriptional regulator of aromatic amino acid metabolism
MQRRRICIALDNIGELDQRAHFLQPRKLSGPGSSRRVGATREIENTKQTRIVCPHLLKLEAGIVREGGETLPGVFIGEFRDNFLT